LALGAASAKSAVLYAHTWGANIPDYIGIITDGLVLNPWDREILQEQNFVFHPEYVEALKQQDVEATPDMLIPAGVIKLAKE
jgi:hypothetical protein